jgi:hypothetical protein
MDDADDRGCDHRDSADERDSYLSPAVAPLVLAAATT